jgi:hypothetical protein
VSGRSESAARVAWVESPLQLLNVVEYAASTTRAVLIEPRAGVLQLDQTVAAIRSQLPANAEITAPVASISSSRFRLAHSRIVGDVYSGQFRSLVATTGIRDLVIVDDGSATVHFAATLGVAPLVRMAQTEGVLMRALGRYLGSRLVAAAADGRVTLFTTYSSDPSVQKLASRGVRLVANHYDWLRSVTPATGVVHHPLIVLGSALVTDGQVGVENYLDWVRSLAKAEPLSYLPHRRESAAQRGAVAAIPGVTVEPGILPVELVLGASHALHRVETLPSSAVATLRAILPTEVDITVTPVPESWWLAGADPHIRRAFDQLADAERSINREENDREDDRNVG